MDIVADTLVPQPSELYVRVLSRKYFHLYNPMKQVFYAGLEHTPHMRRVLLVWKKTDMIGKRLSHTFD